MKNSKLSLDRAKILFNYDPVNGKLYWSDFALSESKRRLKKDGGLGSLARGYLDLRVDRKLYKVHRLIWFIHYGEWPKNQIDHINGITTDNRICNLRDVTNQENQKNRGLGKNNTSGFLGVHKSKNSGKWFASVTINGVTKRKGPYKDKQKAIDERSRMSRENGFHENHGNKKSSRL